MKLNQILEFLRAKAKNLIERSAALFSFYYGRATRRALDIAARIKAELIDLPDRRERHRRVILLFAFIFLFDYLMYCLHTDKNIVDIFPEIPSLDHYRSVSVYIPSLDGISLIQEKRSIPMHDSDEKKAKALFEFVVRGSSFENTSMAVPVDLFVRKIWIYKLRDGKGKVCVFDFEPAELRSNATVIQNSENLFKLALEKTITKNIPSVKSVIILEKGIPGTSLWEL
jgi:hypothetical protein